MRDNIHSADLVRAFAAFHASPRSAAVYNIGGGSREQLLDARGDRALRADRRAGRSTGSSGPTPRIGDHRWWISDLSEFRRDYPGWQLESGDRGDPAARSTSRNVEAWSVAGLKLSVVIPAHNEADSIGATRRGRSSPRSSATGIDYEILVVDDASTDGTAGASRARRRANPRVRCIARTIRPASASRSARASTSSRATRSRS